MESSSAIPKSRRGRFRRLRRRSVWYYKSSHAAVALGIIVGTATLTGALVVGDSMRGSLRASALERLGGVEFALAAPRFLRSQVADALSKDIERAVGSGAKVAPVISLQAAAVNPQTKARAGRVALFGVDERFWKVNGWVTTPPREGEAYVSERIAGELGLKPGEDVLLRFEKQQAAPMDTLLGRRDELGQSIRVRVVGVLSDNQGGAFELRPSGRGGRAVFINLAALQRAIKLRDRVNAVVVGGDSVRSDPLWGDSRQAGVEKILADAVAIDDFDLRLKADASAGVLVVESRKMLLEPATERAVMESAAALGATAIPTLAYVVNEITGTQSRVVPYSTVCAIESTQGLQLTDGATPPALGEGDLLINQWTADDLGAKVGDTIRLKYFVSRPYGRLEETASSLTLRGIVRMTGLGADAGLVPTYEGITDTKRISDWNPPFPMDMKRIRPRDEAYWDQYKAAPKAFVSLAVGLKLWGEAEPRYGRFTSVRIAPSPGMTLSDFHATFEKQLLARLRPADFGLAFEPVRAQALHAAVGSTDFGMLFLGFSFFLIVSAAMLVALLFRLGMERRAAEVGLLLALGWPARRVRQVLIREGASVAAIGVVPGIGAALGYAWLMLAGLKTWWAQAADAPNLSLHVSAQSLAGGMMISFFMALASMAWSLRSLTRVSAIRLLAADVSTQRDDAKGRRWSGILAGGCLVLTVATLLGSTLTDMLPKAAAFFGAGALLLVACLSAFRATLMKDRRAMIHRPGMAGLARVGARNEGRHVGRSMLVVGLSACASFVIVAVAANRQSVDPDALTKNGGAGGFQLLGESVVPLAYDMNTREGREALSLSAEAADLLKGATVVSLRLQPGDDTSCLNLYQAARPRILGAPPEMVSRGGFAFSASIAGTADEHANPWTLFGRRFDDGAAPCIGDANTVQWLLHSGVGQDFVITDERGQRMALRFVGLLSGSVLQGELVISEEQFVRRFPSVAGYGAFLIEAPAERVSRLEEVLERDLAEHGLDLENTSRRLAEYLEVENTYLSAFQTLGGLGFVLGACGLAVVMLRNTFERRREFALLRALGYRERALSLMVFIENAGLLAVGLAAGTVSALIAVAPHIIDSAASVPWSALGQTLGTVLVVGLLAIVVPLRSAVRAPLLEALRRE